MVFIGRFVRALLFAVVIGVGLVIGVVAAIHAIYWIKNSREAAGPVKQVTPVKTNSGIFGKGGGFAANIDSIPSGVGDAYSLKSDSDSVADHQMSDISDDDASVLISGEGDDYGLKSGSDSVADHRVADISDDDTSELILIISSDPPIYSGGGDPRARVTQMGVLSIVSGQIKGKSVASADIFGKGGFATDIDSILSGVGGLKSGGDGGVGRKGVAGIGYGSGYGSGFSGGGGGVDDLLGGLMGGTGGGLDLKRKGELKVTSPDFLKGGALTGGRSRASIKSVIKQNMATLRDLYNERLREKPGLTGKISVKFAIDEFGKVIFAQIVESTMSDSELESTVVSRVKSWNFEKIDKPGDVTEATYPFVFSQ